MTMWELFIVCVVVGLITLFVAEAFIRMLFSYLELRQRLKHDEMMQQELAKFLTEAMKLDKALFEAVK